MQAAAVVQPAQVPVVVLQNGVLPEQWLFWVQDWHKFVAVLQLGFAPEQWAGIVHWTQRPLAQPGVAALLAMQRASVAQAAQEPSTQIGFAGSTVQSAEAVHSTQAPIRVPVRAQRRLGDPQSLSPVQARHRPGVRSQTGVMPAQCELAVHWTQVLFANRQYGVGARQSAFIVQPP